MNAKDSELLLLYYYNELPEDKMVEVSELVSKNMEYIKFIDSLKNLEKMYTKAVDTLKVPEVKALAQQKKRRKITISNFMWVRNAAVAASILFIFTLGANVFVNNDKMSHVDLYNVIAFVDTIDEAVSVRQATPEEITAEQVSDNFLSYQGFDDDSDLTKLWIASTQ